MSKLQDVMAELNKKNKETFVGSITEVPRESGGISFGLTGLDRMFKTRGVPRGRITQLVAEANAGKSTLAMGVIASLHTAVDAGREKRGMVLFIDTERTFEEDYARNIGVQVDDASKFLLMRPDDGIAAIDAIEKLIDTGELDLVVLDSITFLIPRAYLEMEADKNLPAAQSRQNSMLVQRLIGRLAKTNTAMLIVNHLGSGFKVDSYGNPILDPRGGRMLANATSALVWLKKSKRPVDEKGNPTKDLNDGVAADVTITIKKNKLGRQDYEIPARMVFGQGFDPVYDLLQTAIDTGVVQKKGAWTYFGEQKWNGENALLQALSEDVDLYQKLREAVLAA
ncbi:AAA family ATPase [Deinococcus sp. S9]|uniref:AAA family ATPase n=1 Tax=Deinococcus sp. S9 TaxID=2545754 RepID=UPI001055EC6A|nr:AAA family ATPase [Deinococcus sp. S9]TDE87356.1 hypothetical protein E0686_02360 [Deinococcus sp. S9]